MKKILLLTALFFAQPLCDAIHLLQDGRIYKSYHPVEYPLLADKLREDTAAKYDAALSRVFGE